MHIAIIDPSLFTPPYDAKLCRALDDRGHHVKLYGRPLRPKEQVLYPYEAFFYRRVEQLRPKLPGSVFKAFKAAEHTYDLLRLADVLRPHKPVIHFQWSVIPMIDQFLIPGLFLPVGPTVLTVHDITPFNGNGSRLQRIGGTRIFRQFDHLIVHGENGREAMLRHGIEPHKISVIPHGPLDATSGKPTLRVRQPGEKFTILMFGKIKPYKGIDIMIEALGKLLEGEKSRVKLLVVGEPMMDVVPLQERAKQLGVDVGWVLGYLHDSEIDGIMSRADVFAFPYREIDSSGVLMMSFPYKKPIIATRIGAFERLLEHMKHGFLVENGYIDGFTNAVTVLLNLPNIADKMGERVGEIAPPSWDDIARLTVDAYGKAYARWIG